MNNTDHTPTTVQPVRRATPDKAAALSELGEVFRAEKNAAQERATYVAACIEAARRLAEFAWSRKGYTDDAEIVVRMLASIYNGSDARRVRLDEIRWLAWPHQRDLAAVMLGTGQTGTEDTHIRNAFHAVGGRPAVDWLHSFLDYQKPEHPAEAAARVRRVLTEESRTWSTVHRGGYLETAAKSAIEAKITAAIKG